KLDGSTRIVSLWDQTLKVQPGDNTPDPITYSTGGGSPPKYVVHPKGVEFHEKQINDALNNPDQPLRHQDDDGHGTRVAGIAAGNGSQAGNCHGANYYQGVAPNADIVIVKTTFGEVDSILGAAYVFQYAQLQKKAAVVNLSLGNELGAHDGTSSEEKAYD